MLSGFYFVRSFSVVLTSPSFSSSLFLPCLLPPTKHSGAVFGGYFSDCWTSSDDYKSSFKPFLFALDDDGEKRPLEEREVFVCEKVGGPEAALFDYGAFFFFFSGRVLYFFFPF